MKALIYNDYLETSGGGERLSLNLLQAYQQLGYQCTLATSHFTNFQIERLLKQFGTCNLNIATNLEDAQKLAPDPTANTTLLSINNSSNYNFEFLQFSSEAALGRYCKENSFDVFINSTFCSVLPNPAPFGLYIVMFPPLVSDAQLSKLRTYNKFLAISDFSNDYASLLWENKSLSQDLSKTLDIETIIPPISSEHFAQAEGMTFNKKEKIILLVGRFNVFGHQKNQLEAIEAISKLFAENILDSSWKFFVVGKINEGEENKRYFEQCQYKAKDFPHNIQIFADLEFSELCKLYQKAFVYLQFSGFNLPFGINPEACEHLGFVTLDALAYGAIPIVYQRGGMSSILDYGVNGFLFEDYEELRQIFLLLNEDFKNSQHLSKKLFSNCVKTASEFTMKKFTSQIRAISP